MVLTYFIIWVTWYFFTRDDTLITYIMFQTVVDYCYSSYESIGIAAYN